jgi:hypothetical protein
MSVNHKFESPSEEADISRFTQRTLLFGLAIAFPLLLPVHLSCWGGSLSFVWDCYNSYRASFFHKCNKENNADAKVKTVKVANVLHNVRIHLVAVVKATACCFVLTTTNDTNCSLSCEKIRRILPVWVYERGSMLDFT